MTPERYTETLARVAEAIDTLRQLEIPAERVHSLSVQHWSSGTVVEIHVEGKAQTAMPLVDRIADHYGLPADDGTTSNYTRGESLGGTPVLVYSGRPDDSGS